MVGSRSKVSVPELVRKTEKGVCSPPSGTVCGDHEDAALQLPLPPTKDTGEPCCAPRWLDDNSSAVKKYNE